jgi:hypothetical protein
MKALKIVLAAFGTVVVFLGLVFLIGDRPVEGAAILLVGAFLLFMGLKKPKTRDVVVRQELELTGDTTLESLKCKQCGGTLSSLNTSFRAGAVFVSCPYCHSEYQLEEAPKW